MRVIQYDGEYIANMEWVESYENCIQPKNKCTYLDVPDSVILNQQNNKTYDLQYTNIKNNNRSYKHAL